MNSKIEHSKDTAASGGDIVKYAAAVLLALAGLFAWFWFGMPEHASQSAWSTPLRGFGVVLGLVAGLGVFMLTAKGRDTREFLSESRFELRKVVWPTRQEAIRMTWVVMVVVTILSLLLGGFDYLIQLATQWFLGR
ncbi:MULTISPECIES: preprotein translocase subunit SecE [unclassified Stenotrophomonas]|uniref:preprotein translocase subunit SecE n=1 Tax=unclassified Stenotrophomonas TaxID=196198 RepID=UPI00249C0E04|nr:MULTISPECIES: preprotein translocase subunit SecE [unclassified Stenotrophomonas]